MWKINIWGSGTGAGWQEGCWECWQMPSFDFSLYLPPCDCMRRLVPGDVDTVDPQPWGFISHTCSQTYKPLSSSQRWTPNSTSVAWTASQLRAVSHFSLDPAFFLFLQTAAVLASFFILIRLIRPNSAHLSQPVPVHVILKEMCLSPEVEVKYFND